MSQPIEVVEETSPDWTSICHKMKLIICNCQSLNDSIYLSINLNKVSRRDKEEILEKYNQLNELITQVLEEINQAMKQSKRHQLSDYLVLQNCKSAMELVKLEIRLCNLVPMVESLFKDFQSKTDEAASYEQAAKDREQALQQQLKETEADRDHLKNQVAKSKDYAKLLENTLTQGKTFVKG